MPDSFAYMYQPAETQSAIHALPDNVMQPLIPHDIFNVYGEILKSHCICSIDDNTWKVPYRDGLQMFTVRFDALDVTKDELQLIKAYIVDTLSHHSSPSACINRVKDLAFLFTFLHQRHLTITMLSSPVIRMYRVWLDHQPNLTASKKNHLEATLKSFIPFLRQLHLLRPVEITIPKPRPVPKSKLVRAPEDSIMHKLDQFFFDFDNPIPSDFRCAYLLARMIPARNAEVFSLPLDCFSIHDDLLTVSVPTFKETPNHVPIYQDHHRLVHPFPECALVRALQEQQEFARAHQSDMLSPPQKERLMVSSQKPHQLTRSEEFNRYLQTVCEELSITDHTGAPAHVTMYSLRHAIGAAINTDADIPSAEFTRAFSHTNRASDCGYGYSSQYDELRRTASATRSVRNHLTANESTNSKPRIVLPGRMAKMQLDPQSQLIGTHAVCHQHNCKPQLSSCVHCDSFVPDPQFIPAAKDCCKILTKRIEQCKKSGNSALLEFNEQQLLTYQTFISRAQTM